MSKCTGHLINFGVFVLIPYSCDLLFCDNAYPGIIPTERGSGIASCWASRFLATLGIAASARRRIKVGIEAP